jgi:cardiolipin synthase (CMP-forming)
MHLSSAEDRLKADILKSGNLNTPNIISACRLATVPILFLCIFTNREILFTWILLAALISDIVDGAIARAFNMITRLGASLDSAADMGTYISAIAGIFAFKMDFIRLYWPAIVLVLVFYVLEKFSSFMRYRRIFNAFHTYLSKITAYAQGAFVVSLFLFGYRWYLFYPAVAACIVANIEEILIAGLAPGYPSDVKGIFWVLAQKKKRNEVLRNN